MICPSYSTTRPTAAFVPSSRIVLQCGQNYGGGTCDSCRGEKKKGLQRSASGANTSNTAPGVVHDVIRSPSRALDSNVRAFIEPRFDHSISRLPSSGRNELTIGSTGDVYGQEADRVEGRVMSQSNSVRQPSVDFDDVRTHTDEKAAASARAAGALAYTVALNIVFASNQHQPETSE